MKRVAIVQARMGSSRLPGKILEDIAGRSMLERVVARVRTSEVIDELVIATTTQPEDEVIVTIARTLGVRSYRGSSEDVLGRFAAAADDLSADIVVRITADCPLIDPAVVGRVVRGLEQEPPCDYASNVLERTYPRGLDAEGLYGDVLARTARLARSPQAREHVTWFIYGERPDLWTLRSVTDDINNSDLRWTVDTPGDLELVRRLYRELDLGDDNSDYRPVVAYVRAHPELAVANQHVRQRVP
jgi:spore coat polysaccharide biosynthesis protein SpsF